MMTTYALTCLTLLFGIVAVFAAERRGYHRAQEERRSRDKLLLERLMAPSSKWPNERDPF